MCRTAQGEGGPFRLSLTARQGHHQLGYIGSDEGIRFSVHPQQDVHKQPESELNTQANSRQFAPVLPTVLWRPATVRGIHFLRNKTAIDINQFIFSLVSARHERPSSAGILVQTKPSASISQFPLPADRCFYKQASSELNTPNTTRASLLQF